MDAAELRAHMAVCDRYFLVRGGDGEWLPRTASYDEYVRATNALHGSTDSGVIAWARQLLAHADFDAWELGASLLGGARGAVVDDVIRELDELIRRPIREDAKELQAKDVAIMALGELGAVHCLARLRDLDSELRDSAKTALAAVAKQPFATAAAAFTWANRRLAAEAADRDALDSATGDVRPYSPSTRYAVGDRVDHATLGVGVVRRVVDPTKVEILFAIGARILVHGR